ncbi:MAG: rRNA maturation RNase YbeY [Deltaproteobacteria bacterium]|nr:rRNA maturation RNase YbeY [Deltaproteobacteria bacterium]
MLKDLGCRDAELSILLTDNNGIQRLNKRYLKKDRPTDVLSFPMWDFNSELRTPNSQLILGDIVISLETAKTQAKENDVTLKEELARLLIHGILHLLGFDHEKSSKEARRMRKEEERLLKIAKYKLQNATQLEITNWKKIKS